MALTKISTDGVKDDAVTAGKIPANAVGTSEIANNAVTSTQIADNTIVDGDIADATITLNKLVHGTSSNDGKFLRANNGADPSFETVTSTTINNNADNRVITGSGTANTLNGESGVQIDSSSRLLLNKTSVTNTTDALTVTHPAGGSNGVTSLTVDANNHTGTHANAFIFTKAKNTYWGGYGFQSSHGHIGAIVGKRNTADDDEKEVRIEIGGTGVNSSEEKTWKFRNNGNLALSAGHVEVASGYGIDFSATSNAAGASSESEILDDYEEGNHTVGVYGSGGGSSVTVYASENKLSYNKIGNLVIVKGRIRMNAVSYSGSLRISLPYTVASQDNTNNAQMCAVATHGPDFDSSAGTGSHMGMFLEPIQNSALAEFSVTRDNASWTQATNSIIGSGNYLAFQLMYNAA